MVNRSSTRFRKLLIHTCAFQVSTAGVADAYGHADITWEDSVTDVPCLFMPKAHKRESGREVLTPGADVFISGFTLFVENTDTYNVVTEEYRITDVHLAADDSVVDAGPFDIELVKDAAGQSHHLELYLTKKPMSSREA